MPLGSFVTSCLVHLSNYLLVTGNTPAVPKRLLFIGVVRSSAARERDLFIIALRFNTRLASAAVKRNTAGNSVLFSQAAHCITNCG